MANLAIPHVDKKHVLQNTWYRTTRTRYCNCCNKIIDNGELYQYLFLSDGVKVKATLNLCLKCGQTSEYAIDIPQSDKEWITIKMDELESYPNEVWKSIDEFDGYEVSNIGRVRSLPRIITLKNGRTERFNGGILSITVNKNCFNRLYVSMRKTGDKKTYKRYVHRLVSQAFIPNPNNYSEINHIDENPNNNKVENLEWCTRKYNLDYGTRVQRMKEKLATPVLQFDLNGNFIKEYESQSDAARAIGGTQTSISCCVRGIYDSYKGYKWRYKYE